MYTFGRTLSNGKLRYRKGLERMMDSRAAQALNVKRKGWQTCMERVFSRTSKFLNLRVGNRRLDKGLFSMEASIVESQGIQMCPPIWTMHVYLWKGIGMLGFQVSISSRSTTLPMTPILLLMVIPFR